MRAASIKNFCKENDFIRVCYLFGSVAKNKQGKLSDIDFGFLLDKKLNKKERHEKRLFLIREMSGILKNNKVDIIVMNDATYSLNYEIIKSRKIIFNSDDNSRVDFETNILSKYLDRRYYDLRHANSLIKKIAKEGVT